MLCLHAGKVAELIERTFKKYDLTEFAKQMKKK